MTVSTSIINGALQGIFLSLTLRYDYFSFILPSFILKFLINEGNIKFEYLTNLNIFLKEVFNLKFRD